MVTGISQLFGLPPDELSELPGYEEPIVPDTDFGTIEQLWGDTGLSSSSSKNEVRSSLSDDANAFDGISQLWGEKLEDETEDLLSSSATRRVGPPADPQDSFRRKESRLSELLADEVYSTEEVLFDNPITFEDYQKQVQEILEAEREELLETEAIMNAPPGAEDIAFPGRDGEKPLEAIDVAEDDLAILEMDNDLENDSGLTGAAGLVDGLDESTRRTLVDTEGEVVAADGTVNGTASLVTVDDETGTEFVSDELNGSGEPDSEGGDANGEGMSDGGSDSNPSV